MRISYLKYKRNGMTHYIRLSLGGITLEQFRALIEHLCLEARG